MRVLISNTCGFWLSRVAVERARELDAPWAGPDHMPLLGEKEHHEFGPDWREFVHGEASKEWHWHGDEEAFLAENDLHYSLPSEVPRHDPILLQIFDEMEGVAMEGSVHEYSEGCPEDRKDFIQCVEIPDDVTYYVGSYTGEWIAEQHRVWEPEVDLEGRPAGTFGVFTKDSRYHPRRP